MKFPQEFVERVREASNIVDIISQYVQLRRTGHNLQGLCPFHNEKSPSFSVSEDKQVYHCFGCKASGNVYSFVQNYQGMTFPEAIEFLARRAGLPLPAPDPSVPTDSARDLKATLNKINGLAAQFYHQELQRLSRDHQVWQYLVTRGLTEEVIERYKIGYAPDAWTALSDFFTSRKVPVPAAESLGLIKRRTGDKSGHYDFFRHRIIFPVLSPTGQCLGFGGRVLSKDQQPKYLNSADSSVFHKGKVFYGLYHSTRFIRSEDEAIVVEGYMDWLALAKVGIENVVATLGTALTPDHARLIKRYAPKVLVLFDGDAAGKEAARRSLPVLLAEGLFVRGLFLPDALDPDDFIAERGVEALREHIRLAPDLFDLIIGDQWRESQSAPSAKVQMLDAFAPILAQVQDERVRSLYERNLAQLIDVDIKLVRHSHARPPAAKPKPSVTPEPTPVSVSTPPTPVQFDLKGISAAELEILNLMLLKEVYLTEALASDVGLSFAHAGGLAVFKRIADLYGHLPNQFASLSAQLVGEVRPVESITRHMIEPYVSLTDEAAHKWLQDCIRRVKGNYLRQKSKDMVSNLRAPSAQTSQEQLEQLMNIQKHRARLAQET